MLTLVARLGLPAGSKGVLDLALSRNMPVRLAVDDGGACDAAPVAAPEEQADASAAALRGTSPCASPLATSAAKELTPGELEGVVAEPAEEEHEL